MTESFKNAFLGAKSIDEAYDILMNNMNEFTETEQKNIYLTAAKKEELSEEELECITGGNGFTNFWKSVGKWCSEHKSELILAACIIGGAALGIGAGIAGVAYGLIGGTTGFAATMGGLLGGTAAGLFAIMGLTDGGEKLANNEKV